MRLNISGDRPPGHYRRCVLNRLFLLIFLAGLSGCASSTKLLGSPSVTVARSGELPPPSMIDSFSTPQAFRIGPYDKIRIDVAGIEELVDLKIQVDSGGTISVPMVGSLMAIGKTTDELANEIERGLRRSFVRNPVVSVNAEEINSQRVTIDGSVKRPGSFPVRGSLTLMRSIAEAEGVSEYANLRDVVVFRSVKGKQMAALFNVGAIRRGVYADPPVYPGDLVVVGDSKARSLFDTILKAAPLITAPLYLIFR